MQYERCGEKGCHIEENRRQVVIKDRQRQCRCQKKEKKKAAYPIEGKAHVTKRYTTKRVRKHSQRGGQSKRDQENLQNAKRSIDEYWSKKVRYT